MNYAVEFVYADVIVSTYAQFLLAQPSEAILSKVDRREEVSTIAGGAIVANATAGPEDYHCEQLQYICFLIKNDSMATFADTDITNNIRCLDLDTVKECYPGECW